MIESASGDPGDDHRSSSDLGEEPTADPGTALPKPSARAAAAIKALERVCGQLPGGGEVRSGQAHMAAAVADAITSGEHLIVEAGTGTGKSLAYLVPVVLSGEGAVIATATKSLQDQLADKDLPFLARTLDRDVTFAVLKGRSNYVCVQRLAELERSNQGKLDGIAAEADPDQLRYIKSWVTTTTTGDRAEMAEEPSAATWNAVSVGPRECPGASKCPSGNDCFAEQARTQAAESQIIIVNMHLYGLHLGSDGAVLPPHDVVVFDEAHVLEEVISATMGVDVTPGRLAYAGRAVASLSTDTSLPAMLEASAEALKGQLADLSGEQLDTLSQDLNVTLNLAHTQASNGIDMLRKIPDNDVGDVTTKKVRAINALTGLVDDLHEVLNPGAGTVRFVEGTKNYPAIKVAPIEVDDLLSTALWDTDITAVLASATIPPKMDVRLGIGSAHNELDVGSPFDYPNQALMYCAAHMPDPRSADFAPAMHIELDRLIRAAGGRTLALFTSLRAMNEAYDAIGDSLPFTVYVQGELPKPLLVSRFAEEETSCLFATMGFWQGIDVPGRTLSMVTIDKLPFARPNDPLFDARRRAAGPRAFQLIDIPRAATLLAQGVGRLIRTSTDRGVVAVFDPRLANAKSYRWDLIKALPPMKRTKDRADAIAFLREIRDDMGATDKDVGAPDADVSEAD